MVGDAKSCLFKSTLLEKRENSENNKKQSVTYPAATIKKSNLFQESAR